MHVYVPCQRQMACWRALKNKYQSVQLLGLHSVRCIQRAAAVAAKADSRLVLSLLSAGLLTAWHDLRRPQGGNWFM